MKKSSQSALILSGLLSVLTVNAYANPVVVGPNDHLPRSGDYDMLITGLIIFGIILVTWLGIKAIKARNEDRK